MHKIPDTWQLCMLFYLATNGITAIGFFLLGMFFKRPYIINMISKKEANEKKKITINEINERMINL